MASKTKHLELVRKHKEMKRGRRRKRASRFGNTPSLPLERSQGGPRKPDPNNF